MTINITRINHQQALDLSLFPFTFTPLIIFHFLNFHFLSPYDELGRYSNTNSFPSNSHVDTSAAFIVGFKYCILSTDLEKIIVRRFNYQAMNKLLVKNGSEIIIPLIYRPVKHLRNGLEPVGLNRSSQRYFQR